MVEADQGPRPSRRSAHRPTPTAAIHRAFRLRPWWLGAVATTCCAHAGHPRWTAWPRKPAIPARPSRRRNRTAHVAWLKVSTGGEKKADGGEVIRPATATMGYVHPPASWAGGTVAIEVDSTRTASSATRHAGTGTRPPSDPMRREERDQGQEHRPHGATSAFSRAPVIGAPPSFVPSRRSERRHLRRGYRRHNRRGPEFFSNLDRGDDVDTFVRFVAYAALRNERCIWHSSRRQAGLDGAGRRYRDEDGWPSLSRSSRRRGDQHPTKSSSLRPASRSRPGPRASRLARDPRRSPGDHHRHLFVQQPRSAFPRPPAQPKVIIDRTPMATRSPDEGNLYVGRTPSSTATTTSRWLDLPAGRRSTTMAARRRRPASWRTTPGSRTTSSASTSNAYNLCGPRRYADLSHESRQLRRQTPAPGWSPTWSASTSTKMATSGSPTTA